jgi:hypothetical protein
MTEGVEIALIGSIGLSVNCLITAAFGVVLKRKTEVIQHTVDGNFNRMWNEKEKQKQALMELRGENSELIGKIGEIEKNGGTEHRNAVE